jgi:hypothetical protein
VNKKDNSLDEVKLQARVNEFLKGIESLMPETLDESAKTWGAIIRKRAVKSAASLLMALMMYAITHLSFRMLAYGADIQNVAAMSDTAWHKKFKACENWLMYLVSAAMPKLNEIALPAKTNGKKVYLLDGSIIMQDGKAGHQVRVHALYNLTAGCMADIKVTDNHTAESFKHFKLEKGAIYIADAGYGKAKEMKYIAEQGAEAILRVTPNHVRLVAKDGELIDMSKLLKESKKDVVDFECNMQDGKELIPVRIIASRLPEEKAEIARSRKIRGAQKKQSKIKGETLEYAGWVILATTLKEEEYTSEDVLVIYRSRWQIELVFKRFKQHCKIRSIRVGTEKYARTLVLVWLLIWLLTERQAILAEQILQAKEVDLSRVSRWTLDSICFQGINALLHIWALVINLDEDIDRVEKYLLNHKAERRNQYSEFHFA